VLALRRAELEGDEFATMADLLPTLDATDAGELEGFQKGFGCKLMFGFIMCN
jgi:hypothetical protein